MSSEPAETNGPSPEFYAGDSTGDVLHRLIAATRPKFFPASVLPVLAGTAWGYSIAGSLDWLVFVLALLATVCVHAGANVLNERWAP